MATVELNDEVIGEATKFLMNLNEKFDLILERLDDLETKIDNLSLYGNEGFSEVEGL